LRYKVLQTHRNGKRSEMPNKALKSLISFAGTACRRPLA
jgi:hypothetical protein